MNLSELSAELSRRGLIVDKIEGTPPEIYVRTPRYQTLRLCVRTDGTVMNDRHYHFPKTDRLPAEKLRNIRAVRELVADVVGRERMAFGDALKARGWPLIAEHSVYELDDQNQAWVLLSLKPRLFIAHILDREVRGLVIQGEHETLPADFPSLLEEPSEFEEARLERLVAALRADIAAIDRERARRPARTIEAYFEDQRDAGRNEVSAIAAAAGASAAEAEWRDIFEYEGTSAEGLPVHYLIDSAEPCRRFDGYAGGHDEFDRILELCEKYHFPRTTDGSYSPGNAAYHEDEISLLDGRIEIYAGDYDVPGAGIDQGLRVHGALALRWLLDKLGYEQPDSIEGEKRKPTPEEFKRLDMGPFVEVERDGSWSLLDDDDEDLVVE